MVQEEVLVCKREIQHIQIFKKAPNRGRKRKEKKAEVGKGRGGRLSPYLELSRPPKPAPASLFPRISLVKIDQAPDEERVVVCEPLHLVWVSKTVAAGSHSPSAQHNARSRMQS